MSAHPPPKHSSSLDSRQKEKPKQDIGYYRVLGIQKEKNSSQSPSSLSKYDKLPSPSFNPMNLFSGEKKEDRVTRVKLNYYKQLLQADIKLAEKAYSNHEGRYESLQIEFSEQKGQLTRWGLESLIKNFRMQSWLRQSRGDLLMNMSKHIIQTLQTKLTEVTALLAFLNVKNNGKDKDKKSSALTPAGPDLRRQLDTITDVFYSSPETMLEKDKEFLKKRQRLSAIDKLCHMASAKFRESLPELNSKDFAERSRIILSIVKRYSSMLDPKNLCMNNNIAVNGSWHEFSLWYEQKSAKELQIYEEYLQFIDDEREREGRLFRRWCNLVRGSSLDLDGSASSPEDSLLPSPHSTTTAAPPSDSKTAKSIHGESGGASLPGSSSSSPQGSSSNSSVPTTGADAAEKEKTGGTIEANAAYIIYPKCVQIFIRYFAINIIAATHDLPQSLHSALLALTETVIHRTVHSSLFRYPSEQLRRKDTEWRVHALRCRYADPLSYHIAPKHLGIKKITQTEPTDTETKTDGASGEEKDKDGTSIPLSSLETHLSAVCSMSSSEVSSNSSRRVGLPIPALTRSSSSPITVSSSNTGTLHSLVEEDESDNNKDHVTPIKPVATSIATPPSASSTTSYLSSASELSLTPPHSPSLPLPPPSSKPGGFTQTPPTSHNSTKKKSSSTGTPSSSTPPPPPLSSSSSSSRSRMARARSSSSNGLAAIGGKTAYCEKILQNITIIHPLHKRMEYLLANSLDKAAATTATMNSNINPTATSDNLHDIDAEGESATTFLSPTQKAESEVAQDKGVTVPVMVNLHPAVFSPISSGAILSKSAAPQKQQHRRQWRSHESVESAVALMRGEVALYALPARVLGLLQLAVSPRDAIVIILLAIQWLTRTAMELLVAAGRGASEALGADDVFPLLVNVLAHSNIPCIHLIMHYLHTYTAMESFGEAAYYVTSMGAAVEFIDTTYVADKAEEEEEEQMVKGEADYKAELLSIEDAKMKEKELGEAAVNHLGEWLRDQQVMEDTMVVMMQEGWMG